MTGSAIGSAHGLVVFSHGKDSSPQSLKIQHLTPVAEQAGWRTLAVDYSDTNDPHLRKDRLVSIIATEQAPVLLVGSSLGGVVSVFAAREVSVSGLFLLAPAVYWPGYDDLDHAVGLSGNLVEVIHGWRDDVVPYAGAQRFAQEHLANFHLLDDDHSLHRTLPEITQLFVRFLERAAAQLPGRRG